MSWWVWALIAWSTAASVAVLWLAAEVSDVRSRELRESSAAPLELPWISGTSPDPLPLFQFDPKSIAVTARAAFTRSGLGNLRAFCSTVHVHCGSTVATARGAISKVRAGGPAAITADEPILPGQMDRSR
jgi:hypothetical protein